MYLDREIDIYWYYNDNSNNRNDDSDGDDDGDNGNTVSREYDDESKIKNVRTILSVPILLICDLSSDSFVVIVVIATVVAIIIHVYIDTL